MGNVALLIAVVSWIGWVVTHYSNACAFPPTQGDESNAQWYPQ